MAEQIRVELAERGYDIVIEAGQIASGRAGERLATLANGGRVCLVTHPELHDWYAAPLADSLSAAGNTPQVLAVPSGEASKTLATVAQLYSGFAAARLDRKSLIVAVGGGVLGDMAGFAAASYMRGLDFVQVPTTLLAQVDSSVGGKTGVDLPEGKNLVGAFHQPLLVLIDPDTLRTLPDRELRAGLAEVIKYGIIYDEAFFLRVAEQMSRLLSGDTDALACIIARSCAIKADVVGQDEREQGLRAILNFGHTIGHALEAVTRYERYKHGEAIAIGMVSACLIGQQVGVTPPLVTQQTIGILQAAGLPTAFPADIGADAILEAAQQDKKTLGGRLRFVLASAVGVVQPGCDVPETAIRAALADQQRLS